MHIRTFVKKHRTGFPLCLRGGRRGEYRHGQNRSVSVGAFMLIFVLLVPATVGRAAPSNYCLEFNGDSSVAIINTVEGLQTLNGADRFTFEAWIRPRTQGEGGRGRILQQVGGRLQWYLSDEASFGFRAGQKAGWRLSNPGAVRYWEWQHIAVSSDGVYMRYFVNGKQVNRLKKYIALEITDSPLWIGNGQGEDINLRGFDGWIDELRISKECLYPEEFTPLRHLAYDSTTVMLFHFDEDPTVPFALDETTYNAEIELPDSYRGSPSSPRRVPIE
jgi:hypothetical protein